MRKIDEIENDLIARIADIGDDKLQDLFLEWQNARHANMQKTIDWMERKDPVFIGATIGALIGSLFIED